VLGNIPGFRVGPRGTCRDADPGSLPQESAIFTIQCPHCSKRFTCDAPSVAVIREAREARAVVTVPVTCPHCRKGAAATVPRW